MKVVTNFSDGILKDLKNLSSYIVNLMKIVNLTEKLGHIMHLNFCTSSQFIIGVRNSSCFFLLLSSETGIISQVPKFCDEWTKCNDENVGM